MLLRTHSSNGLWDGGGFEPKPLKRTVSNTVPNTRSLVKLVLLILKHAEKKKVALSSNSREAQGRRRVDGKSQVAFGVTDLNSCPHFAILRQLCVLG